MNDARERSYYEIALTNGQVLGAFAILLVCVAGAFVSGMWVARDSFRDRLAALDAQPAAAAPAEGEPSPDTFEFFGTETAENAEAEEAAPASPLPRLGSGAAPEARTTTASPEVAEDAPIVAEAAPEPRPAAAETRAPASAPETERREPERASAPPERGSDAPAAPAAAREPEPAAGAVVIQVFSGSDEGQANGLISRLRGDGYRAFLSPVEVDGRTLFRVRVGPYESRSAAETDAAEIKRRHRLDTWFPRS